MIFVDLCTNPSGYNLPFYGSFVFIFKIPRRYLKSLVSEIRTFVGDSQFGQTIVVPRVCVCVCVCACVL